MQEGMRIHLNMVDYARIMGSLDKLERIEKNNAINKGLKEGAEIVIRQGRANLASRNKVRKGNLRGSFTKKVFRGKGKLQAGFKRPKGAAAHLVDRGTVERYTKKGQYRGRVVGTLFWTDAVQSRADEASRKMMESIQDEITKIMFNL